MWLSVNQACEKRLIQPAKFGFIFKGKKMPRQYKSFKVYLGKSSPLSFPRSMAFHVEIVGIYLASLGKLR